MIQLVAESLGAIAALLWILYGTWMLLVERDFQAGAIGLTCGNVFLLLGRTAPKQESRDA